MHGQCQSSSVGVIPNNTDSTFKFGSGVGPDNWNGKVLLGCKIGLISLWPLPEATEQRETSSLPNLWNMTTNRDIKGVQKVIKRLRLQQNQESSREDKI